MDVTEFERVARVGLGRAVLHLQTPNPEPYRDVIMEATLHNWQFDTEKSTRERYVLELIELTGNPAPFRAAILDSLTALAAIDDESFRYSPSKWDAKQLGALARQLASEGDAEARNALRTMLGHHPTDDYLVYELLELEGEDGVRFLANVLGKRLASDVDHPEWDCAHVASLFDSAVGEEKSQSTLATAAGTGSHAAAFLAAVQADRAEPRKRKPKNDPRGLDYDDILGWMTKPPRSRYRGPYEWNTWGKHADADELNRAATTLLAMSDDDPLLHRHVQVFGKRPFPLDPQRLIDLARRGKNAVEFDRTTSSREDLTAVDSLFALGNVRHPAVREFALELLAEDRWPHWTLDLLIANFEDGDLATIDSLILKTVDPNFRHHMTMTLKYFFRENRPPGIRQTMLLCYEHGPCRFCRWSIVKDFLDAGSLPDWVKAECRFDANTEIRELFEAHSDRQT